MQNSLTFTINLDHDDGTTRQHALRIDFPLQDGRDLVPGPLTYKADGLFTAHNCDFIVEPRFATAYQAGINTGHRFGTSQLQWRAKVACWAANQVQHLEGDFVECGVNTGILSRAVCTYLDFNSLQDKRFYLLDTYNGIPLELTSERERAQAASHNTHYYFDCYEMVCQTFSDVDGAVIIRGRVPDTLDQVLSEKVCYLSIDMNARAPEIAAITHFWDKLVAGAIVVLDDYGFAGHDEQRLAFDEFVRARDHEVLPMPTGQGLIIKK